MNIFQWFTSLFKNNKVVFVKNNIKITFEPYKNKFKCKGKRCYINDTSQLVNIFKALRYKGFKEKGEN